MEIGLTPLGAYTVTIREPLANIGVSSMDNGPLWCTQGVLNYNISDNTETLNPMNTHTACID